MTKEEPSRRTSFLLMTIFLLLVAGIGGVGFRFYAAQKRALQTEVANQLSAIAAMQVNQGATWRRARWGGARLILVDANSRVRLKPGLELGAPAHYAELAKQAVEADGGAPLRLSAFLVILMAASLIAATGVGVGFLLRHQRLNFYRQKYQSELELRALLEHYQSLTQHANDIILLVDADGRILEANQRAVTTYGYAREEFVGMDLRQLRDPETWPEFQAQWDASQINQGMIFETRHRRRDGSCFPVEVSAREILVEGKAFRQSFIRDISERKAHELERARLEEQIQQAQKMESVGRLAGGVAHDFNNHLTVINGYCDLLLAGLPPRDALSGPLEEIRRAGERAAALTKQLLAVSRKQVLESKALNLNTVIADVVAMLRHLVGEDIEIETRLDPELGTVEADAAQIQQVLMNLVVNARDAMPKGGRIVFETLNVELDQAYLGRHADSKTGPHVQLVVSDSGAGMNPDTQQHIFEPFFTTKGSGAGAGLGLATVYGIVKQSGGWIWVYSEPGRGTTFKIYLPRVESRAEAGSTAALAAPLGGTETILVVEDQEELRTRVGEMLEGYGYQVLAAANGDEALDLCAQHTGPLDLMITDVVMPRMTGRELFDRLAQSRSQVKVLYVSGYTANVIAHQEVLDSGAAYLPKPFSPEELARKVRQVLAG